MEVRLEPRLPSLLPDANAGILDSWNPGVNSDELPQLAKVGLPPPPIGTVPQPYEKYKK